MTGDLAPPTPSVPRRPWVDGQLAGSEVGLCRLDQLAPARSPRGQGIVEEHVRLLVESTAPLPPIIVHRPTMRVVDGMHRLRAAAVLRQTEIAVRWYDGEERDIFAMGVQANVVRGLPLSLADRRNAAAEIVATHPHWSNRMIALVVNLASTTVRAVRGELAAEHLSSVRVGLDGRTRPTSTATGRRLAGELLRDRPELSIRGVARLTGLAPSTVLDVRNRLRQGLDPVPARQNRDEAACGDGRGAGAVVDATVDHAGALPKVHDDPALLTGAAGGTLLRWFEAVTMDSAKRSAVIDQLPSHCLDAAAMLATGQAAMWQELADQLRERSAGAPPGPPCTFSAGLPSGLPRCST